MASRRGATIPSGRVSNIWPSIPVEVRASTISEADLDVLDSFLRRFARINDLGVSEEAVGVREVESNGDGFEAKGPFRDKTISSRVTKEESSPSLNVLHIQS